MRAGSPSRAAASRVDKAKLIRDQAKALEAYARDMWHAS